MEDAASEQERIVHALMSHTFGSPLLFWPKKYSRKASGWKQEEPADLAWAHDNLVALFYMNESKTASLDKQIEHNQKQSHRFIRLWASKDPRFALRGVNSFRDECFRPFDSFSYLLVISIVSSQCGVRLTQTRTFGKTGFTLVLPADFLRALATADGTFVDMLLIARLHLSFRSDSPEDDKTAFMRLIGEWQGFIANTQRRALEGLHSGCPLPSEDTLRKVYSQLAKLRVPATAGQKLTSEWRSSSAKVFGDLSLGDYLHLAYAVANLFHQSELTEPPGSAPVFRRNCALRMDTWHHGFVLHTAHIGGANNDANINAVLQQALALVDGGMVGRKKASLLVSYQSTGFSDPWYFSTIGLIPQEKGNSAYRTFAESVTDDILADAGDLTSS